MSTNMPPNGPSGGPEYLEHGGGAPLSGAPAGRRSPKPYLLGGAAVGGVALVGGAAWAAMSFMSTGDQPAEALPAATLGYVSIDLDPGGAQKIEAVRTLNKFPAFKDELGLDTDDDLRRVIFEESQKEQECANLDYAADIEPWLGARAAVAAVDTGGEAPDVAVVVQVNDAEAAEAGLAAIRNCAQGGDAEIDSPPDADAGGFVVEGDWAVLAETTEVAEQIFAAGTESSLADDETYSQWMERAGDPGILSMYVAPEAGAFMADAMGDMAGVGDMSDMGSMLGEEGTDSDVPAPDPDDKMLESFKEFKGLAATVRFEDGAVELEMAGDPGVQMGALYASDRGDDVMAALPADTAVAFGMGFEEGWLTQLMEQISSSSGMSVEEMMEELSAQTGLDLPGDIETLLGESATLAISSDFDMEQMMASGNFTDVPVGVKIKGDPGAIESVLDKIRQQAGMDGAKILDADNDGDLVAIGPNADYRAALLEDGSLGDSDTFRDVIAEAEQAAAIGYVDFDAGDDWLASLAGNDQEIADNVAPLSALGMSAWQEDGIGHSVIRVTTD